MPSSDIAISSVWTDATFSPAHIGDQSESIMIYVAFSGSMIPLRVLGSDSIDAVKLRIQSYKGFVVKNQKLVCDGRELARSNTLIGDYGVTDGDIVHLVLRLSDLQVINVKTSCGKEFTFHVELSRDVGYIKHKIAHKKNASSVEFDNSQEVIICNGEQLEDGRLVNDIFKSNDGVVHLFVRRSAKIRAKPVEKHFELSIVAPQEIFLEPVIGNPKIELPFIISEMIDSTLRGLERGKYPIKTAEGTGGAYFMPDDTDDNDDDESRKKYVSVFKPTDEEPLAVNNPRSLPPSVDGEGLKKGNRVGEGALKEVAAYILDHSSFSGVPPTTMVKCLHRGFNHPNGIKVKIGSLQMFMENHGSCEDIGPGAFPVEQVHKISVLDLRLANADRHAGNILVKKEKDGRITKLIPIDHGYCLPDSFEDCTFEWLYWPQAKRPYNQETVEYINSLNAEEDIALLKFQGWNIPIESARTLRISTMLLKKGVERGFTPYTIGNIMCRESLTKESMLEEIVQEAVESMPWIQSNEDSFIEAVSRVMDRRLDEISR